MNNLSFMLGILMILAFLVNIIVQLTKGFIPIPTKLWCIIVSAFICITALFASDMLGYCELNFVSFILSFIGSFVVSYIAMYGFDTFKNLWQRFKKGEKINEDN